MGLGSSIKHSFCSVEVEVWWNVAHPKPKDNSWFFVNTGMEKSEPSALVRLAGMVPSNKCIKRKVHESFLKHQ